MDELLSWLENEFNIRGVRATPDQSGFVIPASLDRYDAVQAAVLIGQSSMDTVVLDGEGGDIIIECNLYEDLRISAETVEEEGA